MRLSGKIEVVKDLLTNEVIGPVMDGFANFKSFEDIPSWPVAFLAQSLSICLDIKISFTELKLN